MGILAIIPARKGSSRLPDKNKSNLCGKPMVVYTIEEAKKSKYIDTIIVSTDDKDIKRIAREYKVYDYNRPKELSTNDTPTIDVIKFVLRQLPIDYEVDMIILLQPTSPLRIVDDIDRCIDKYLTGAFSSIVSVVKTFPGRFRFNGAVYITSKKMIDNGNIWDDDTGLVIMPYERSVDVDTKADFELCEMLLEKEKI